jgi:uncharacterized protein YprB with RNaseH-like and TPR domain
MIALLQDSSMILSSMHYNCSMPSLSDKLKSLGVKVGTADLPKVEPALQYEIEKVVPGAYRPTPNGESFVAQQTFGADYRHGNTLIRPETAFTALATWAREPRFLELPLESYAFLDTETSGLAGGTGTYAFMVGVGRFRDGEFQLEQFFMRDPAEEANMLELLAAYFAPMQALVTFNGKAFDAPLLFTRYALHRIPNPLADFAHLDLLPLARRLWRDRLPSRALKYLEEKVPGYEIPYLYFDYLRSRDARPLKGVFYHNAMDVVAMAALLSHVTAILEDPFGEMVEHGLDVVALGKLFEDLGEWDVAARLFERGLEMELPEAEFWLAVQRLSHLQRRRGDLETAVDLWESAAGQGHVYAHVELAKYYEHKSRDYAEALKWTHSAMELVSTLDIPRYMYKHWMEELSHRLERLDGKIQKRAGSESKE